jgi:hypothetical protein
MSNQPMHVVRSHKTSLRIGVLAGLALLCVVVGYLYANTPARPNVQSASANEIVSYVSNDRGLASLSQIEQEQFLKQWQSRISSDSKSRDDLKECFKTLSDESRKKFVLAMTRQFKRAFLDDAKHYASLDAKAKYPFIVERLTAYATQAPIFKDLTKDSGFNKDMPGGPDDVQMWVMDNTTAEERAIGEPYIEAMKRIREQQRKQQSGATSP